VGRAVLWDGVTFLLGPANAPDAVTSRTIALPAGRFNSLRMLAAAIEGDQESQVFAVNYSDGMSSMFSQSISDWYTPENFSGESDVLFTPYRLTGGERDNRRFHMYGYSFSLNDKKVVRSFALPANPHVLVLGLVLVRGPSGNRETAIQRDSE